MSPKAMPKPLIKLMTSAKKAEVSAFLFER